MFSRNLLAGSFVAAMATSIAVACGPFFPTQLLDNRSDTLKGTPANSFAFEAAHLIDPPSDSLKAVESDSYSLNGQERKDLLEQMKAAGPAGLLNDLGKLLRDMRRSTMTDDVLRERVGLPDAVRLYTAGAKEFSNGNLAAAAAQFQAVLELANDERRSRAVWAAYMLGRSFADQGIADKASAAFAAAQAFAVSGAPDPLGLAVASYGEEAKIHLDRANGYFEGKQSLATADSTAYARELGIAVRLYAEQAARGSNSAVGSLRMIAEQLLKPDQKDRISAAVEDPMVERLLVVYALARVGDIPSPAQEERLDHAKGYQLVHVAPIPLLTILVGSVEAHHQQDTPQGADRLAAMAYRVGRYGLAQQLAARAPGPLASWVKAKLALQRGNLATAAGFYAEASRAFPPSSQAGPLDNGNVHLLVGEGGVLALARGEYVDALDKLYPEASRYCGDVAYVAERVLTVDELKAFVDAKVAATHSPPQRATERLGAFNCRGFETAPDVELRDLLARRLVRKGRYSEATAYFHGSSDATFDDPDVARHVADYARALHNATASGWSIDKARALYQAAVLARDFGMEMMGYEGPPDFAAFDGAYDGGIGQGRLSGLLITDGERRRFAASAANPPWRFHYRFTAVDEASRAADLLPPRSQAFAAVLCQTAGWMREMPNGLWEGIDDSKRAAISSASQLYRRYLKEGPFVPWATHFGRSCPEPDFDGAARLVWMQPFRHARHFAGRHRWALAAGLVAAMGLAGLWLARRQAAPPVPPI